MFSDSRSVPEKCVRLLSGCDDGVLFAVKLPAFQATYRAFQCDKHLQKQDPLFLLKSHGSDFTLCFLLVQRMQKIKARTSIFSFDYKHMPGGLRLTSDQLSPLEFRLLFKTSQITQNKKNLLRLLHLKKTLEAFSHQLSLFTSQKDIKRGVYVLKKSPKQRA